MNWKTYLKRNFMSALGKTAIAVLTIIGGFAITSNWHGIDVAGESKTMGLVALSTFAGVMIPASTKVLKDLADDGEVDDDYSFLFSDSEDEADPDDLTIPAHFEGHVVHPAHVDSSTVYEDDKSKLLEHPSGERELVHKQ